MNIHPRASPLQPANKEGGGMRTLKQEGIPFRIEGIIFLPTENLYPIVSSSGSNCFFSTLSLQQPLNTLI